MKARWMARLAITRASSWFLDAAAHHRVDIDVEEGMVSEQLQLDDLELFFDTSSGWTLSMEICI